MKKLTYLENYYNWLENVSEVELKKELLDLEGNDTELKNRFSNYLTFGTAGLRGIIGVGTNNINIYTISKAVQAVSEYVLSKFTTPLVVVAYDSRKFSYEFAIRAAEIFTFNGIKVKFFSSLTPTPILSYAVRKLNANMGVSITSSHNAKEYNGFKVINETGCQIDNDEANEILLKLQKVNEFKIKKTGFNNSVKSGNIELLNNKLLMNYLKEGKQYLFDYSFNKDNFNLIYTPLHGVGKEAITEGLKLIGVNNYMLVKTQSEPDENFSTIKTTPNPELIEAFDEALSLTKQYNADLILATDPDCDRVGAMVKHKGKYVLLTGDEIAVVLLDYILKKKKENNQLNEKSFFVNSVVSLGLTNKIANHYGVTDYRTLTGFKNIGKKVEDVIKENKQKLKSQKNANNTFVFAYEESIGYMVSPLTRDKDGILPTLLVAIIAAELKSFGKTLIDYLESIYNNFGRMVDFKFSIKAKDNSEKSLQEFINKIEYLRNLNNMQLNKLNIIKVVDYLNVIETGLEPSNFIEFIFENKSKLIVRPSGTEPILKIYITIKGNSKREVKRKYKKMLKTITRLKLN